MICDILLLNVYIWSCVVKYADLCTKSVTDYKPSRLGVAVEKS
jgi:hypothetical protein